MPSTFTIRLRVTPGMTARFFGCEIHPLYATFAIVEHAEYASRCAIRSMIGPEEDAVGSAVEIEHRGPAPVGTLVTIEARIVEQKGKSIICEVDVRDGEREIAKLKTTQVVLPKEKVRGMYGT